MDGWMKSEHALLSSAYTSVLFPCLAASITVRVLSFRYCFSKSLFISRTDFEI